MRKPRNPHLFEALRAYVGDALSVIRSHNWGPDGLPARAVLRIKIEATGMSSHWATGVDWSYVLLVHEKELRGLGGYSAVVSVMRADPTVAKHLDALVGDGGFMARVDADSCIRSFLLNLLMRHNDLTIDTNKLYEFYGEFEAYFHSDVLKGRALSALTNFEMEADQVELEPGLLLRRLSLQEREEMASSLASSFMPLPPFVGASSPTGWEKFTLDLLVEVPKVIGYRSPDQRPGGVVQIASEKFQAVISALRLFKAGLVDSTSVSTRAVGWHIHSGFGGTGRPRLPILAAPYTLSEAECHAFADFWTNFQKQRLKKHKRVDLAMRRFSLAYERLLPEDRLIDYVIALEALLMRDEQQELAFRLALRGSVLLGQNADSRSQVYSRLRAAYGIRSHVVHGGVTPPEVSVGLGRVPFGQFIDLVADDVRAAISKMLELTESAGEAKIIESLDDTIIRGG